MMNRKLMIGIIALVVSVVLAACGGNEKTATDNNTDTKNDNSDSTEEKDDSAMNQDMEGHMDHDEEVSLKDSTGENEIEIPSALGSESENEDEVAYTVRAQEGETEIYDGTKTKTLGYNGDFLGPVRRFNKGDKVKIKTINDLDEETTFHCHGLEVRGEADGGPPESLKPRDDKLTQFEETQEASTRRTHPDQNGHT